jgi:hypothetical protein
VFACMRMCMCMRVCVRLGVTVPTPTPKHHNLKATRTSTHSAAWAARWVLKKAMARAVAHTSPSPSDQHHTHKAHSQAGGRTSCVTMTPCEQTHTRQYQAVCPIRGHTAARTDAEGCRRERNEEFLRSRGLRYHTHTRTHRAPDSTRTHPLHRGWGRVRGPCPAG